MDKTMDRHLVINALLTAIWQRKPKREELVHRNQENHNATSDYLALMKTQSLAPPMSRRENDIHIPVKRHLQSARKSIF